MTNMTREKAAAFGGADRYQEKPTVLLPIVEIEKTAGRFILEAAYLPIKLTSELVGGLKRRLSTKRVK